MNLLVEAGTTVGACFQWGIILGGAGAVIGAGVQCIKKERFSYTIVKEGAWTGAWIGGLCGVAYVLIPGIANAIFSTSKNSVVGSFQSMTKRTFWIALFGVGLYEYINGSTLNMRKLGAVAAAVSAVVVIVIVR